ncbi:hypothetical protein NA57DRAFT_61779 [Rhizodiscina lignyota]|uniref:Uncharacterized protein n=1 Tax=Rhizodiscina lignyota TaxID=1504668 RepID=A0A9P4M053_9PEZI|nr:hypothetical protein NA57DRAFT_61779 [Rhizodiscina lignyota]
MSNSSCPLSVDTLLALGIPSISSSNYYSCSTATNYTRFATCCAPEKPHVFSENPCYSWCDLPSSLNAEFDEAIGTDDDAYSYMKSCLEQDGTTTVQVLYCSAKPHVVSSSPGSGDDDGFGTATATGTDASFPTSTFDSCATAWPPRQSDLAGYVDPHAGCAILLNASNIHSFEECCDPAPLKLDVTDCYEYCVLPRGDGADGAGNLTVDQTLGSFKACMMKDGNGLDNRTLFGGMYCRANKSAVNLSADDFGAQAYLPSGTTSVTGGLYIMVLPVVVFFRIPAQVARNGAHYPLGTPPSAISLSEDEHTRDMNLARPRMRKELKGSRTVNRHTSIRRQRDRWPAQIAFRPTRLRRHTIGLPGRRMHYNFIISDLFSGVCPGYLTHPDLLPDSKIA